MTRTTVTVTLTGPVAEWLARQQTGAASRADVVAYIVGEHVGVDPGLAEVPREFARRVVDGARVDAAPAGGTVGAR